MNKFIPKLSNLCAQLRPLLKKDQTWIWTKEHDEAIENIKEAIQNITEMNHFRRSLPIKIICDARKEGLGAVL